MKWRDSNQLGRLKFSLIRALKIAGDGKVVLSSRTARNLVEVCNQAMHTEKGHEPTAAQAVEIERVMREMKGAKSGQEGATSGAQPGGR